MARSAEEEARLQHVLTMYREVLVAMNPDAVDRFLPPQYIQHSMLAPPGLQALKDFLTRVRKESPDATQEIKQAFVDGDHVIVHVHVKRWPDDPGLAVVDIFRLEDGAIIEHWDVIQEIPNDPQIQARVF